MLAKIMEIISIVVGIYGAYFTVISLCFVFRQKKAKQFEPVKKFAVLIPCRNEEAVIGCLIESLKTQDYPGELYDIYVVPNNCTDDTELEARRAGALILNCIGDVKCKGDALNQAMSRLMLDSYDYDAFCVFDADNIVEKSFLLHMNNALCSGARAAKARLEAKNPYDSWVAGCYSIYFGLGNLLFNRAKSNIGLSARLVGTGFVVAKSLLEELGGWKTSSLAEDAEFSSKIAALGERVYWVEDAVSYDEQPNSFRESMTQRRRWVSGIMQVAALCIPPIAKSLKNKNENLWRKLDFMLFIIGQHVQALAFVSLAGSLFTSRPLSILISLALSYAGTTAMAAFIAIATKKDKRIIKSIFTYAIFTASWLPLQVYSVFRKNTQWKEMRHRKRVFVKDAAVLRL